ncbi:MAG: hypothetical protein HKP58_08790 [Desulfatitalea sp.]|nr:hypothetical protein [Desulfatitalea sp.]NNK00495.1 hypothetical protein [Desulfatitalea sp.]
MSRYPNQRTKDIITNAMCEIFDVAAPWPYPDRDDDDELRYYDERMVAYRRKLLIIAFRQMLEELDNNFNVVDSVIIESSLLTLIERRWEKRDPLPKYNDWEERRKHLEMWMTDHCGEMLKRFGEDFENEDRQIIEECVQRLVHRRISD